VVVAVSGVSYSSYVIQKLTKAREGVILGGLAGGRLLLHRDHLGSGQDEPRAKAARTCLQAEL